MDIQLVRTTSSDPDFLTLIRLLDEDLQHRYGRTPQSQYDQLNRIGPIETVVIAYADQPVGCGCFKPFDVQIAEVKRMFVRPDYRGRGVSRMIVSELETWAAELGYLEMILETGNRQPEAIGLYQHSGYSRIDNYGPYVHMPDSFCFSKKL
ncbi:MAG TPA: GNAT family N-acetyltransferase [Flavilitoribacter sp.]|nr:GNAT family N-acetyltransferase [Flavilitoribacter sp.]HMQ87835.1 GNAT family N-acetyltransferase [Flavilitoribacter sp.]